MFKNSNNKMFKNSNNKMFNNIIYNDWALKED